MIQKPVVGIYFSDPGKTDDPLARPKFRHAYFDLIVRLESRGVLPVIVRGIDTYLGGARFSRHWTRGKTSDPKDYQDGGEITVNALFNRGRLVVDDSLLPWTINDRHMDKIENNKAQAQIKYADLMPRGAVIEPNGSLAVMSEFTGSKVVIKHARGSGGVGVFVATPAEAKQRIAAEPEQTWVIQEYIDTSAGVPGIIDCEHDIRVLMLDDTVAGCVVRPRDLWYKGQHDKRVYRSSMLSIADIPKDLLQIVTTIDAQFQGMLRYYSLDFMFSNGRWYLLEVNSTPGLIPEERGELAGNILDGLADYLARIARRSAVN